jgi:hypothetical protein
MPAELPTRLENRIRDKALRSRNSEETIAAAEELAREGGSALAIALCLRARAELATIYARLAKLEKAQPKR